MKKKVTELIVCLLSVICFLTACHAPQSEKLADGTYSGGRYAHRRQRQGDGGLTGGDYGEGRQNICHHRVEQPVL